MVLLKSRGEIVFPTEGISIKSLWYGPDGTLADLDAYPQVNIQQPSGNVALEFTSAGVYRVSVGVYAYDFITGINVNYGVWTDTWRGYRSGNLLYQQYNFMVNYDQMPAMNTDGYAHLGDDVAYNFSQTAIYNINKLIKAMRARLNSRGKIKVKDSYGNPMYVDCDIYTVEQMVEFLMDALSDFNSIPHFTDFTYESTDFLQTFGAIIVQRAVISAMASKALIERGRELSITDSGINFTPPGISELLNSEFSTELSSWWTKVELIKKNMKPISLGLGTLSGLNSPSPAVMRLRHLRQRRLY
jgi:hypothetical protein